MNVVDRLLKADVKKAEELETGSFSSKRLAKILGEKEAVPLARISVFRGGFTFITPSAVCLSRLIDPFIKQRAEYDSGQSAQRP
mgnify:CR=1 FL=1